MAEQEKVDKWTRLKQWVVRRHDYFEKEYTENNLSSDAAELGAYRAVYGVMKDLETQEQARRPVNPVQAAAAARP